MFQLVLGVAIRGFLRASVCSIPFLAIGVCLHAGDASGYAPGDYLVKDPGVAEIRITGKTIRGALDVHVPLERLEITNSVIEGSVYLRYPVQRILMSGSTFFKFVEIAGPVRSLRIYDSRFLANRDAPLARAASFEHLTGSLFMREADFQGDLVVRFEKSQASEGPLRFTFNSEGLKIGRNLEVVFGDQAADAEFVSSRDQVTSLVSVSGGRKLRFRSEHLKARSFVLSRGLEGDYLDFRNATIAADLRIVKSELSQLFLNDVSCPRVEIDRSSISSLRGSGWAITELRHRESTLDRLLVGALDISPALGDESWQVPGLLQLEDAARRAGNYDAFLDISETRRRAMAHRRWEDQRYGRALLSKIFGLTSCYGLSLSRVAISILVLLAFSVVVFLLCGEKFADAISSGAVSVFSSQLNTKTGWRLFWSIVFVMSGYFLFAVAIVTVVNLVALSASF